MATIQLAFETPNYGAASKSDGEMEMHETYPSLTIPNNLPLAKSLQAGQEFEATVKFRVSEVMIRERADGKDSRDGCYPGDSVRVELEAKEMTVMGIQIKEDSGEKDGKAAMDGFFKGRGKKEPDGDE